MAFAPHKSASEGRDVNFLSADNVHLRGTYWEPREAGAISVLLLHDYGTDRTIWKPYIGAFRGRGWGLFSLDLRGHGESLRQDMRSEALVPQDLYRRSSAHYPVDVQAALAWLSRQPKTDYGRIGTLGVGLGADLAYAASAKGWGAASTVLVSLDEGRARELGGQGGFSPRSCYLMCGDGDPISNVSVPGFLASTSMPKDAFLYTGTAATGIALYTEKFPEIAARTIAWLERTC